MKPEYITAKELLSYDAIFIGQTRLLNPEGDYEIVWSIKDNGVEREVRTKNNLYKENERWRNVEPVEKK